VIQKKIFNHDIMHCTHDAVAGNYLYSGRVLGISEPGDVVQLHPDLKSEWDSITAHYRRIGLSYSQNPIWDVSFDRLSDYPDREVSVFIFTDALQEGKFTGDSNWLKVVEFINSKNNFIRLAQELEVRVPKTLCWESKAALKDISEIPFPCYLKPAISVDGVGIYRCENEQQLTKFLNHRTRAFKGDTKRKISYSIG
jgi:glutathione synthase/RimK-type ligase-like ATP-grasp enzyme